MTSVDALSIHQATKSARSCRGNAYHAYILPFPDIKGIITWRTCYQKVNHQVFGYSTTKSLFTLMLGEVMISFAFKNQLIWCNSYCSFCSMSPNLLNFWSVLRFSGRKIRISQWNFPHQIHPGRHEFILSQLWGFRRGPWRHCTAWVDGILWSFVPPLVAPPSKFSMESEKKSLEKEAPLGNHHFQVPC